MNTNRIHVFHTADGDGMVVRVTHYLELDFFVTFYALFDQYLMNRGELEGIYADVYEFFFVICKAAAGSA